MLTINTGVILALCLSVVCCQMCTDGNGDPCLLNNNQALPFQETRHPAVQVSTVNYNANSHCDLYATNGNTWYRSDYNMTSSCVEIESCGSEGPIWMNGTIPAHDDGIVDRMGCLKSIFSCCNRQYSIRVKNCKYYTVYCFMELPSYCPQRYCFDIDLSLITTTTTTRTTITSSSMPTTQESTSSKHHEDGTDCHPQNPLVTVITLMISIVVSLTGNFVLAVLYYKTCRSTMNVSPEDKSEPYKLPKTATFVQPCKNNTCIEQMVPPSYEQLPNKFDRTFPIIR